LVEVSLLTVHISQSTFADQLAELISGAPKFDFLPIKYHRVGIYHWKDEVEQDKQSSKLVRKTRKGWAGSYTSRRLLHVLAVLALLIWIMFYRWAAKPIYRT
jgi:hypothetical protein